MQPLPGFVRLTWDEWNRNHIAGYGVTTEQVEAVIAGESVALESYEGRTVVIGASRPGLVLAVVVGPVPNEPGAYYVFTARPASRKERRYYSQERGGVAR